MNDSNLDKLAKAEADVIAEYYGVKDAGNADGYEGYGNFVFGIT